MEEALWSCEERPEIFQCLSTPLSDPHQMPYHQHYAQELICHLSGPNHIHICQQSPNSFILINLFQALNCQTQETTFCLELILARNLNLDLRTMPYQHDLCPGAQLSIPLESTRRGLLKATYVISTSFLPFLSFSDNKPLGIHEIRTYELILVHP